MFDANANTPAWQAATINFLRNAPRTLTTGDFGAFIAYIAAAYGLKDHQLLAAVLQSKVTLGELRKELKKHEDDVANQAASMLDAIVKSHNTK